MISENKIFKTVVAVDFESFSIQGHYGFLDLIFYQTTSISPPWVPGVSKNREEPTELDFRVFGCNHEVLQKLEAKNS